MVVRSSPRREILLERYLDEINQDQIAFTVIVGGKIDLLGKGFTGMVQELNPDRSLGIDRLITELDFITALTVGRHLR